ncbi:CBS domain-containing protein [Ornithinimicrobium cryptoxanthini]|uniref:CBS domain-containing protein n=1 Tax=Ornithinimicrobium cryptoxanthini TaxID=2934161 RepID=A0ABY4YF72_9MICO|nr:CBS domain-containing protein [Ornithinimicrobium cryptoxanthini]USQ75244.1 CBS domain-containing protein [Ornithinimicrobium cryptoxanthini]
MTTAREIMNSGIQSIREDQSLSEAAAMMRDLGVGCLPVQSGEGALTGIITDRDIVVRACAEGRDLASTPAGELAQGIVSTIGPDEPVETIVDLMGSQQVKRLPVVDNGEVIGMISESDLARNVAEDQIHHFVTMVYGRN